MKRHSLIFTVLLFASTGLFFAAPAEPNTQAYWFNCYITAAEEKPANHTTELSSAAAEPTSNTDSDVDAKEFAELEKKVEKYRKIWCWSPLESFYGLYLWTDLNLSGNHKENFDQKMIAIDGAAKAFGMEKCYSQKQLDDKRHFISEYIHKQVTQGFNEHAARVYRALEKTSSTPELLCIASTIPLAKKLIHDIINNKISQEQAEAQHYVNLQRCLGEKRAQQFAHDFNEAQKQIEQTQDDCKKDIEKKLK